MEAGERGRIEVGKCFWRKDRDTLRLLAFPTAGRRGREMLRCSRLRSPTALCARLLRRTRQGSLSLSFLLKANKVPIAGTLFAFGGKTGIRTLGRDKPTPVFKTGALNQLDHLSVALLVKLHYYTKSSVGCQDEKRGLQNAFLRYPRYRKSLFGRLFCIFLSVPRHTTPKGVEKNEEETKIFVQRCISA